MFLFDTQSKYLERLGEFSKPFVFWNIFDVTAPACQSFQYEIISVTKATIFVLLSGYFSEETGR